MCNHNLGDIQAAQVVIDDAFIRHIQMAACFVQKQDFRLAVQRAGENQPLFLPARERAAHVANKRFIAHRHGGDFLMNIRHPRTLLNLRHIRRIIKKADIFRNRARKEHIILHHRRAITADKSRRQGVNIVPAQQHLACFRFQIAGQ